MKKINIFLLVLFNILFISCTNQIKEKNIADSKKSIEKEIVKQDKLRKVEFNIKGMTCEIGCARLIQSKLAKTDGINFVKISFKDSLGMVEYDVKKLSPKKIETIVNQISDGTLYHVYNNKEVTSFSFKK